MKVFDYSEGHKGRLLGDVQRANSTHGWLARKGDRVYKITLADAPCGWEWASGATYPVYEGDKRVGERDLTPEEFGVEAICFCTGQSQDGTWNWHVIGTREWNRLSCKAGGLVSEFQGISTEADRAENIAFMVLHYREEHWSEEISNRCSAAEVSPDLVWALVRDPESVKRILDR